MKITGVKTTLYQGDLTRKKGDANSPGGRVAAGGMAAASALPLETVLMTQVIGFSTLIFPYQTPPVTVGMQLAGIRHRDALRLMLLMTALTLIVLLPLNFAWWSLLGYLP